MNFTEENSVEKLSVLFICLYIRLTALSWTFCIGT
jgi:hypothetical protein